MKPSIWRGTCVAVRCPQVWIISKRTQLVRLSGLTSITEGIRAGVAGLAAVVIVMLVYYRRSGVMPCWRWS